MTIDATTRAVTSDRSTAEVVVEREVPVPMRDGTVLRAHVYRPRAPGHWYRDAAYPGGAHGLHTLRLFGLRSLLLPESLHPVGKARLGVEAADLEQALDELDEECRRLPVASYPIFQAAAAD